MTNLQPVDPSVLVAPMLARFMASDRAFAKARRAAHQDMLPCLLGGPSPGYPMPWWWGCTETVSPRPPRLHRISTLLDAFASLADRDLINRFVSASGARLTL
jgi:hypothetical protein